MTQLLTRLTAPRWGSLLATCRGRRERIATTLWIHDSRSDDWLRLSLSGELDLASAPMLEDRLTRLRAMRSPVRLDLSELRFIDSTGIRLLIRTTADARMKRWPVQIEREVSPQVMGVFRLAHLDHLLGWSSAEIAGLHDE